mmetsp:Transcript_8510/g.21123  ORF Transcript_8510/g.21123 Transcript_8510/m.21123 type:complete len:612 (-) Transcript_8510:419-2254(-)|eukprot:CAMPEP_0183388370 /NCGR_PEP_ID=MMETSP0370-20130417/4001_1 /TAXON_ID=268820 /ORGANISM="Peridinium aciculiferum, Strain PAER-2" /LENGTH=611 /DNA_ID=CAMNT_0025567283 /DNA_START=47 /DNA_END=1882 /DNA_ORIENTATION=+
MALNLEDYSQEYQRRVARDFYYKGWRGASDDVTEADQLQVVLKATSNGRDLRAALQKLLESGGDERSLTDPKTGLTKYHTPSSPCAGIHRSCCTSNAPSEESFSRGVDTLRQLAMEAKNMSRQRNHDMIYSSPEDLFRKLLCDIRERLRAVFGLSFEDIINLFPSGTDAELLPALLAFLRALPKNGRGHDVFSVVTAAGEVGSGTMLAAMGQHFAKRLPSGRAGSCGNGERVFGFAEGNPDAGAFSSATLSMRDESGRLLSEQERDRNVEEAVRQALAVLGEDGKPKYGCVVVHMVVGSKTGQCMPSADCLDRLVAEYGTLVLPVVDACQGRLGEGDVRENLDKGRVVLCTGSKFFGGPPFSGVCLLSEGLAQEFEQLVGSSEATIMLAQSKLKEYIVASLMSDDLPNLRSLLPQRPLNYGVLMRWTLALHNMETYLSDVPQEERVQVMREWSRGVRSIVAGAGPMVAILQDPDDSEGCQDERSAALGTIISFHCRCNRGVPDKSADVMTIDELRHVQFLMASDLSEQHPHLSLMGPATTRCFMGQPVDLCSGAGIAPGMHVLRVAASAPLVVRMWKEGVERVLEEDRAVFEKLRLVLGNWYMFQKAISNI